MNLDYSDLKLTRSLDKKIFKWGDKDIEVIKYLPVEDKYDIVMITLQKSFENGFYNPIRLDMHFHLNLIYMYTNLIFSDEERAEESKLYDEIKSSGFLDKFLEVVDAKEYAEMQEDIESIAELSMKYNTSAAAILRNFIDDMPLNAEAAQKIVDNFDSSKYQAVVDFAQAANGGRSIK